MGNLEKALNQINKTYGVGTVVRGDQASSLKIERVSWGAFALDVETGGGVPKGRIVSIHGPFSSGKTSLALKLAHQVQQNEEPNKVVWVDAEGALDLPWAEKLGLDLKKTYIVQPDEGPKGLDIAEELVKTKEIGLLVIDSVANIVPTQETESSMEEWQMGLHARLINKFIRKISMALQPGNLTGAGNKCIVTLLNQERATMDKYHPITTPGGKGKEFAASIIVALRRGDWISDEEGKKVMGHEIHFKVEKNKTFPPKREGSFDFYFMDGPLFKGGEIDNEKSVILYGVEKSFIERAGAIYRYRNQAFKGKEELLKFFKSHPAEIHHLRDKLIDVSPKIDRETVLTPKKLKFKLK
jgi:recombination protein RecA